MGNLVTNINRMWRKFRCLQGGSEVQLSWNFENKAEFVCVKFALVGGRASGAVEKNRIFEGIEEGK
jgi:hypothetical protein